MWVLEPKALPAFIENAPVMIAPSDVALAAFHLSRYVRSEAEKAAQSAQCACHREVATDARAPRSRIRKASRARAPGSPVPGECRDSTNSPADGEY